MPHRQNHRGRHPRDDVLFGPSWVPTLRTAVADLSWLLGRGYADGAALSLVGDRFQLTARQRQAVARSSCSDASLEQRAATRITASDLRGAVVAVDGFNVLITVEVALSGGVLLRGRDGCIRDLAAVHGSYRSVDETDGAVDALGRTLHRLAAAEVRFFLDSPVSNSGRLARRLLDRAERHGWPWSAETVRNPDATLLASPAVAATSDGVVLDGVERWFPLAEAVTADLVDRPAIIDLTDDEGCPP